MKRCIAACAAFACLALASSASANPLCNKQATVLTTLDHEYGEKPVAFGVTDDGSLVQITASKGSDNTWTLVIHAPSGTSCLIAAGQNWRKLPKRKEVALHAGGPR